MGTTVNLLEDEYFGEDSDKKQQKRDKFINPQAFSKLRDHHVDWDMGVFVEILWYHIFFYLLVGPLINIIYWNKRVLLRNLQFWGSSRAFYIQTFLYLFNTLIITFYFIFENRNIYFVEIVFTFLILALRCYVIACK